MRLVILAVALSAAQAALYPALAQICSKTNKYCHPQQVHIAFGEKVNDITVTWSTLNDTEESSVQYGEGSLQHTVSGDSKLFIDGGELKWRQWIHNARLTDLKYNTTYVYIVGSKYGWSEKFSFTTPPAGEDYVVSALIYGDLGVSNDKALPHLKSASATGHYNFALHAGDFAYNFQENNGTWGNVFMNMIQPIAANLPYMVCPGNHETAYNFSHYKNRFSMPGNSESMFYSWNIGPIHFVSINTEAYYDDDHYGVSQFPVSKDIIVTHYNWLVKDLAEANKPENRQRRPWVILYGHRPMLCTNTPPADHCRDREYPHRIGIPALGGYGLEILLRDYGVDLAIWAHEHAYERMWPVFNKKVYNGSYENPYHNPRAPVHVTSGSAGCREATDSFFPDPYEWSAFRSKEYGYARFFVYNKTHLYLEQIATNASSSKERSENKLLYPRKIDYFWLVKDSHKPYII